MPLRRARKSTLSNALGLGLGDSEGTSTSMVSVCALTSAFSSSVLQEFFSVFSGLSGIEGEEEEEEEEEEEDGGDRAEGGSVLKRMAWSSSQEYRLVPKVYVIIRVGIQVGA